MKKLRLHLFSVVAAVSAAVLFTPAVLTAAPLTIDETAVAPSNSPLAKFGQCTAGATILAGKLLYQDSTTNTCKLADADASLAASKVIGIALQGVSSGQSVRYCSYDPSFTLGATLVIGDTLWSSTTAGGITKTAAEGVASASYVASMGVAISTTKMFLNITRAGAVRP